MSASSDDSTNNSKNAFDELQQEEETDLMGMSPQTDSPSEGQLEEIERPQLKQKRFPTLHLRRMYKKRERKAKKGYVQWLLVGETYPEPKFVKPERKGGGIPEFEHNGETYFFPRQAALPSAREGMWTYIHREGEADPINLKDPNPNALQADAVKEWLNMRVSTTPPGLLDQYDLSPENLIKIGVALLIGWAVFESVMGGGLPLMLFAGGLI